MIDLRRRGFRGISWRRIPECGIGIGSSRRVCRERSSVLQTEVQGEIRVRAVTRRAALHRATAYKKRSNSLKGSLAGKLFRGFISG